MILKSWQWQSNDECRIRSANICLFIMALGQLVSGIVGVLSLGFVLPQLDMMFMAWNNRWGLR